MAGQAGLAVSEAFELSPRELHYYLNGAGYNFENLHKSLWETGRIQAYYTFLPHADSKKGRPTMTKFLPLPWDKKTKSRTITVDDFKKMEKAWQVNPQ